MNNYFSNITRIQTLGIHLSEDQHWYFTETTFTCKTCSESRGFETDSGLRQMRTHRVQKSTLTRVEIATSVSLILSRTLVLFSLLLSSSSLLCTVLSSAEQQSNVSLSLSLFLITFSHLLTRLHIYNRVIITNFKPSVWSNYPSRAL